MLNTHPIVLSFQSPGPESAPPCSLDSGRLKTLNAYACPIERWIASAAGGTSQREYSAPAIECSRSRNDSTAIPALLRNRTDLILRTIPPRVYHPRGF